MPQPAPHKEPEYPNEIRALREKRGLSQYALAKLMPGTKQQTIHRHEVGDTELSVTDVPRYAEVFGVDPAEVIGYERLFNDPLKAGILSILDRLSPDDRAKLVRMAEAMAPPISTEPVVVPVALMRAANEVGMKVTAFDQARWTALDLFVERELEAIPEIGSTPTDKRADIVASLYLLSEQDAHTGKKPDYSQYRLFISGQVRALRASRRRQPQA